MTVTPGQFIQAAAPLILNEPIPMRLFRISQTTNPGYDTYDSAVVCAPDEETARNINPFNGKPMDWTSANFDLWCLIPGDVIVEEIGAAFEGIKQGVVCASFNAG